LALPLDYFAIVERHLIRSVADFRDFVRKVERFLEEAQFVWRGVHEASYGMHSSLYRHASRSAGHYANERELLTAERALFNEAAGEWKLLTAGALQLLAELQHTGTPTRLLDFSTDPLTALWFAVEERRDLATQRIAIDRLDGRVFAVQERHEISAAWGRAKAPPWWPAADGGLGAPKDWTSTVYLWRPSTSLPRIKNQSGVFLVGGVPNTSTPLQAESTAGKYLLTRDEIRACTSLAVRINRATRLEGELRGRPAKAPLAFTCRIPAGRKRAIREELLRIDANRFKHSFMYPDHAGFATFSQSIPATSYASAS
jgi:hypothetical protein